MSDARRVSRQYSRTQLVGLVANLRGELCALVNAYRCGKEGKADLALDDEDIENAKILLDFSAFDLSPEDYVDGGFDKSWHDVPKRRPRAKREVREAPMRCEPCFQKCKGGRRKPCGAIGCECYCNK